MKKKILIIGPNFYEYNLSVSRAFVDLGYETKIVTYVDNISKIIQRMKIRLMPLFGIQFFKKKLEKDFNEYVINVFRKYDPQYVLIIKGDIIFSETLEKMKKSILSLWMMDSIVRFKNSMETANKYDYIFLFEKDDIKLFNDNSIKYFFLPIGYDENIYYPIPEQSKIIDILFVGFMYNNRREILEKLVNDFHSYNIIIYGKYLSLRKISTYYKYYIKGYRKYFKNKNISPQEVNLFYNSSKIILNIHHEQSLAGCNPRVFEILGTNSFQIVDSNIFVKENFTQNEIVSFNSYQDLKEKIHYYFNDDQKRKTISENGYNIVLKDHRFLNRVELIDEIFTKNESINKDV